MKVISVDKETETDSLKLREFTVSDGDDFIGVTLFDELSTNIEVGETYSMTNLQISSFKNAKRLKSTHLSRLTLSETKLNVEAECQDNNCVAEDDVEEIVNIISVNQDSFSPTYICLHCNSHMEEPQGKLVTCGNCRKVLLSSSCVAAVTVIFTTDRKKLIRVKEDVLKKVLQDDVVLGDNEQFIFFMLTTEFIVTQQGCYTSNIVVKS